MRQEYRFYIKVYENGQQVVASESHIPNTNKIGMILGQFGHSVNEMKWFKKEFYKTLEIGSCTSWGHNTLSMYIDKVNCEFYYMGERQDSQKVPTELVKKYIDSAISFLEKYYANEISGLDSEIKVS